MCRVPDMIFRINGVYTNHPNMFIISHITIGWTWKNHFETSFAES